MLVRHQQKWHRHDRRGSAVVPSLIAVVPRKTVKTADLRGGTAETLNMFKTSAVTPRVGPISVGSPPHRHYRRGTATTAVAPHKDRSSTSITAGPPKYNRRAIAKKSRLAPLRRCRCVSTAVMALLPRCCHLTGPVALPPTPQCYAKLSPWHRHQTTVVTQWDRHVRSDTAVVLPHREEKHMSDG